MSIYHVNINGFLSKIDSLGEIIDRTKPDIILLNEVKTSSSGRISTFSKKRGYDMLICVSGGIVVAAKSRLKMVNVSTTSQNILSVLIPELNAHVMGAYKRVHLKKKAKISSMS